MYSTQSDNSLNVLFLIVMYSIWNEVYVAFIADAIQKNILRIHESHMAIKFFWDDNLWKQSAITISGTRECTINSPLTSKLNIVVPDNNVLYSYYLPIQKTI